MAYAKIAELVGGIVTDAEIKRCARDGGQCGTGGYCDKCPFQRVECVARMP